VLLINTLDTEKILELIIDVYPNERNMHPLDEKRVTRIFYDEIMANGWYGMDEIQKIINSLNNHSEYNKNRIFKIASVIQMLKDQN